VAPNVLSASATLFARLGAFERKITFLAEK
jgi:hypothetical protein